MQKIFERLFNLIKKTGDKVVFYDSMKNEAYVMMRMEDYEKIMNGDRGQPTLTNYQAPDKIEKINQDIALWSEEIKNKENKEDVAPSVGEESKSENEEESQFYFEPVE